MTSKIVKTTSKGQITLPALWRMKFKTDNYLIKMDSRKLVIVPVNLKEIAAEEIIFDADRDNDGQGVSVEEMIKLLKKA